jgi:cell division protein FtsL
MKKVIVLLSVILVSKVVYAQDIDTKKFCVYQNQLYSAGSIVIMNNQQMKCKEEQNINVSVREKANLEWATLNINSQLSRKK